MARPRSDRPDRTMHRMSTKQLAGSVKDGVKVTLSIFDGDPVTGYLSGWDDDYFFVLEPAPGSNEGFRKKLVQRATNTQIELHDQPTLAEEPRYEDMVAIIYPFRTWVMTHILYSGSAKQAS